MRSAAYPSIRSLNLVAMIFAAIQLLAGQPAVAHEFVVMLRAVGAERQSILTDALWGFLLATTENDGHADETSNGHIGGLDVYVILQPASVAGQFPQLKDAPSNRPDITVVIGPFDEAEAELEIGGHETVIIRPGTLVSTNRWSTAETPAPGSFAARYHSAYKEPANQWAAEGYNAARRIDDAIRPLGGFDDRAAVERALSASAGGIQW